MPYKDPEKQRECKRRSYLKHRDKYRAERNPKAAERRRTERKERDNILSQFPCLCCTNPDPTVIEWHHVCPEDKVFGIKQGDSYSRTTWWEEVLKCVPVCANCHVKIHKNKLCLIPPKLR
jgi:hypothetical protein